MQDSIVLGGGCFWCTEALFLRLKGVESVEPGYAGGSVPNPTYDQVCTGQSGHAEVIKICFDPELVSLHDLLTVFFTVHNPTTLNQQGADRGTQYRSVIFYEDEGQLKTASEVIKEFEEQHLWPDPIVTSLEPLQEFYPAEEYHHGYYEKNSARPYCQIVIEPKIVSLRSLYAEKMRS